MTTTTDRRTLVLACDVCEEPVTGYQGQVHVSRAGIARVEQAALEIRRNQSGRLMSDIPRTGSLSADEFSDVITEAWAMAPASWRIYHYPCWPDPDYNDDHGIAVDEIDTVEKLLDKTAEMLDSGRTWLPYTDWGHFLRRVLKANGCQP